MSEKCFVIDVNVLVSAFLFFDSKPRQALNKAQDLGLVLMSNSIFGELIEVISRPKFNRYLSQERKQELIDDLTGTALFIEPNQVITECRDPKNNKYLELAITGNAECIVTGDQDLLILNPFRKIPIITVQEFLKIFARKYN
jgi:putative PIN family toxin of toxin-antitoxin system